MQALTYKLAEGSQLEDLEEKDRYYLSDAYKRTVLQASGLQSSISGPGGGSKTVLQLQANFADGSELTWARVLFMHLSVFPLCSLAAYERAATD